MADGRLGPRARAKKALADRYAAEVMRLFENPPENPDVRVPCVCGVDGVTVYPGQKCRECATKAVDAFIAERDRINRLPGVERKR